MLNYDTVIKQLKEHYTRYWLNVITKNDSIRQSNGGNKLRTYKHFKNNLYFEPYLEKIRNVKHRQSLTKLRVSSHNLYIETLRRNQIPVNERYCYFCKNVTEDEYHFMMDCKKYDHLRLKLFSLIEDDLNNFSEMNKKEKFIFMLSEIKIAKQVSEFIFTCFNLRENLLAK